MGEVRESKEELRVAATMQPSVDMSFEQKQYSCELVTSMEVVSLARSQGVTPKRSKVRLQEVKEDGSVHSESQDLDRVDELTSGEVAGARPNILINTKTFEPTFGKKMTLKVSLDHQETASTPLTPITAMQTMGGEPRSKNLMDLNAEIETRIKLRLEKEAKPDPEAAGVSPRGGDQTPMNGLKRMLTDLMQGGGLTAKELDEREQKLREERDMAENPYKRPVNMKNK